MLSKKFRASKKEIEETIKGGKTLSGDSLYAKVSRLDSEKAGFSIIVSKKVSKASVGRHYIKRKISGIFEKELKNMKADFKKTIIFFAKPSEKLNLDLVKKDLLLILKLAGFSA